MSYINKELLLIFDLCDLSKQYGFVTDIGSHPYGNMEYTRMKIDTHINELINNEICEKYISDNRYIESLHKQSIEENDKIIKKLTLAYDGKKGNYGLFELYKMDIFNEIYELNEKVLDNDDYNILCLAALNNDDRGSYCGPIYDDERLYSINNEFFLKWSDGRETKVMP